MKYLLIVAMAFLGACGEVKTDNTPQPTYKPNIIAQYEVNNTTITEFSLSSGIRKCVLAEGSSGRSISCF